MELVDYRYGNSKLQDTQRVEATFSSQLGKPISIFFEVRNATPISKQAVRDCLYLIGFSTAYWSRENYSQDVSVDEQLLLNARAAQQEWNLWPGSPKTFSQTSPKRPKVSHSPAPLTPAVFFSGGVDSFFSLLTLPHENLRTVSIEHVENDRSEIIEKGFAKLSDLNSAAKACGRPDGVFIVTNMMTSYPRILDQWAWRLHGCFFAACAHLVSDTVNHASLSSTFTYGGLKPWGSHPLIDPLWSSSRITIDHHGAQHTRLEKTALVAGHISARQHLSVCEHGRYQDGLSLNCSRCIKCYRTMLTLDALGYRTEDIPAFDWSKYSIEQARRFFILGRGEVRLLREIIAQAEQNERYDIKAALEHAIRRSSPLMWMTNLERYLRRQVPAVNHYKTPLKALKASVIRRLGFDSP